MNDFAQFSAKIDAWLAEVEEMTVKVARGLSVRLLLKVLEHSAQFSGDYCANWQYSVGEPNSEFQEGLFDASGDYGGPSHHWSMKSANHPEAVDYAIRNNSGRDGEVMALGPTIFISNSAQHDDAYAWLIEDGAIHFRPGNAGHTGAVSVMAVASRYEHIGQADALALANARIGA